MAEPPVNSGSAESNPPLAPPIVPTTGPAAIERVEPINDRFSTVFVQSPAMGRTVPVQVLLPAHPNGPRPTVYMLDGRSAADHVNNWTAEGGALEFFADKNVNVVFTLGGPASYYTDWQRTDPLLGHNRWETFLTRELPPLIDARFDGNGRNGIQGVSMGAEAAMMLAVRNRGLYSAIAAHSGCYAISSEYGQAQARTVVSTYGGDPDNMFGEEGDPQWAAHDVYMHADALRGTRIYLSAGLGLPGLHDLPTNHEAAANTVLFGGPLEAGAYACTLQFIDRLSQVGIPATINLRPTGTHSWPYWADELPRAWPTLAAGLGID
ncbi:esterase family protein [Nocardia uniformis]|uniref:Esterase family protein n=1 Tax=Nocardia uniformis TaxID=53432 RepID=A0A849C8I5_9NOCA|nr:alpha/beta hydrolase family protein [Nocardia uniformis]NNH74126.1 esterase family protein [Nocardia uniformis]